MAAPQPPPCVRRGGSASPCSGAEHGALNTEPGLTAREHRLTFRPIAPSLHRPVPPSLLRFATSPPDHRPSRPHPATHSRSQIHAVQCTSDQTLRSSRTESVLERRPCVDSALVRSAPSGSAAHVGQQLVQHGFRLALRPHWTCPFESRPRDIVSPRVPSRRGRRSRGLRVDVARSGSDSIDWDRAASERTGSRADAVAGRCDATATFFSDMKHENGSSPSGARGSCRGQI
jgi:hypothetical protein